MTVFIQGSVEDHSDDTHCTTDISTYINGARELLLKACKKHLNISSWGRLNHSGKWKQQLMAGTLCKANTTLGEFWRLFGYSHPPSISACLSACFGVAKERILQHPKSFYEKSIEYVSDHPNPEEGHYIERLWISIFSEQSTS